MTLPAPALDRRWLRRGALAGVATVIAAYGSVLYTVTDVVGGTVALLGLFAATLALATLVARLLTPRGALALSAGLLAVGLAAYLAAVPEARLAQVTARSLLGDTLAMLTGLSVLRLVAAGAWALTVAPGPTLLAWYLGIRGRYAAAASVAGATLGLFVLTGDAGELTTVAGVVGAAVAVGVGGLERSTARESSPLDRIPPGAWAQLESLTAVLAAMVVLAATVGLAAGTGAGPTLGLGGGGATDQASLVDATDRLRATGSLSLSPKVRMVVRSDRQAYWRTAVYDRYTGDGWVRTGETAPYAGGLAGPPGQSRRIRQEVTPRTPLDTMPAANTPVRVSDNVADRTLVTPQGAVRPAETLGVNESYTAVSRQPVATPDRLRAAGGDSPDAISEAYRQLPASTPDRVDRLAAEVAGDEATAYDKAVAVESYLESNKDYSLEIDRPRGDMADAFLFEMEAGYCTYFATAMVTMLRAENVPARIAVGYTPGQEPREGTHVVRGLDAHVWVEVYFPEVGWVRFDPTPAGPRRAAEQERIRQARAENSPGVDAVGSANQGPTPTPTSSVNETGLEATNGTLSGPEEEDIGGFDTDTAGGGGLPQLPSRRTLGLGLIALVGAVAGARRSGLAVRGREAVRTYYQRPRDPETDAVRAWRRVERVLGESYRERRPGETPRAYLDALEAERDGDPAGVDPRAREVAAFYERARYGPGVSRAEAAGAVQRADALTRGTLPLVGRRYS